MAVAAARTNRMKFGMSVMVLPGRNPVLLAKQLATLDRMSEGRLLPAFGLGAPDESEQQAFGVERMTRGGLFDETLDVLRKCWSDDVVNHEGRYFTLRAVRVEPKPLQQLPEVWLGGVGPKELQRVARLAEGWLPSFISPARASAGWAAIGTHAATLGRVLDEEHFGVVVPYALRPLAPQVSESVERRLDGDRLEDVVPQSVDEIAELIGRFIDVGASKFVLLPMIDPGPAEAWITEMSLIAQRVLPLQT
jgi:probable F420-dependent oxidoreductase